METFVRVIDTGSFSSAARQLRVGQPAVSKSIAQLEEWLGVRLLLRSTRNLTATEAGQNFYDRARRTLEEANEAELSARGAGTGFSGRLRVSSSVCFGRIHIIPRLPHYLDQHPNLDIELVLEDRNIDLVEEGIDVALRSGALPDSTLTARRIGRARRMVIGTPAYFDRYGTPATPAELAAHQAVIYTRDGGGQAWTFQRDAEEAAVNLKGRVKVTAAEGVREAVFAGLGLAVVSEWIFTPELASGAVRAVLPDWTLPPLDLWAVYPTGRMASAKTRAFVDFVEDCLASH